MCGDISAACLWCFPSHREHQEASLRNLSTGLSTVLLGLRSYNYLWQRSWSYSWSHGANLYFSRLLQPGRTTITLLAKRTRPKPWFITSNLFILKHFLHLKKLIFLTNVSAGGGFQTMWLQPICRMKLQCVANSRKSGCLQFLLRLSAPQRYLESHFLFCNSTIHWGDLLWKPMEINGIWAGALQGHFPYRLFSKLLLSERGQNHWVLLLLGSHFGIVRFRIQAAGLCTRLLHGVPWSTFFFKSGAAHPGTDLLLSHVCSILVSHLIPP